jgi:hypothetical protein
MNAVVCSFSTSNSPRSYCGGAPSPDVSTGCLSQQPRGLLWSPFLRTDLSPNELPLPILLIPTPSSGRKPRSFKPLIQSSPPTILYTCSNWIFVLFFHFLQLGALYHTVSTRCCLAHPKYISGPSYPPSLQYCDKTSTILLFTQFLLI